MNKKIVIWIFALVVIAAVAVGVYFKKNNRKAQKVYRVGILSGLDFFANTADGYKAKMTELGYIEGKDIVYDLQKTNFDPIKEKSILEKFVSEKEDLIMAIGTEASLEAKTASEGANIPVIFTNANIEGVELVKSASEPGGNITGVRYPGPDIAIKRFKIMMELMPQAKRMLIPFQKGYPIIASQMEVLKPVAAAKGVILIEIPANDAVELQALLEQQSKTVNEDTDAILMIPEPLAASPDSFLVIAKFAKKHNLVVGGAIMSVKGYESVFGVATDGIAVGESAAFLADKIFKGMPAGIIPVISSESYLQINYRAAQAIGLKVPDGLLNQANEVIR
jgi:putative tryptophan/tyrosine transport system substrate-binding protein